MLELIASARSRVLFENFIFAADATGRRFAGALSAAAARGVEVRVLYDPIGTLMVRGGSIARVLRESRVRARPFHPLSPYSPRSWGSLRHRDHRKTLTVDGATTVVGGLCISDHWARQEEGGSGWRDTALLVSGPVAQDLERAFEALWQGARAQAGVGDHGAQAAPESLPAVWMLADWPGARRVAHLYAWLAARAQRCLEITDAYLVLPKRALSAFAAAAGRGVRVRMLLPGHNNHRVAGAAARHRYELLLEAGVEIWEWQGAMVHAKTLGVDTELTLVGSSNLDPLSLRRNFEMNLLLADPAAGRLMHEIFERDLEGARRVEPSTWRRRPRWRRLAESAGSLFSSEL